MRELEMSGTGDLNIDSDDRKKLIGKRIKDVRMMTKKEKELTDWHCDLTVIEFEDGTLIFKNSIKLAQ